MRKTFYSIALSLFVVLGVSAQDKKTPENRQDAASATAREAFTAHGGKKFGELKSLAIRGTADITSSAANQEVPASFVQLFSGEKYRLEVDAGFVSFLQTFDGVNTITSPSRGFSLPPINRVGMALLQRYGAEGFVVSLAEKKNGFRITSPEGYFTDFYINKKTKRVKSYESVYVSGGREVETLVEIDKYLEKDGVVIPSKYAQKFEVAGMTVYAVFKTKEVIINEEIPEENFTGK